MSDNSPNKAPSTPNKAPSAPNIDPVTLSPEIGKARLEVENLESEAQEYESARASFWDKMIENYGEESNMDPSVKSFYDEIIMSNLQEKQNRLNEAKAELLRLEAIANAPTPPKPPEPVLPKVADAEAGANQTPEKKKRFDRLKKIGKWTVAAGMAGLILATSFGYGPGNSEDENEDIGKSINTISKQWEGEDYTDALAQQITGNQETSSGIESVGDYEVADYGFFSGEKENYRSMGPKSDVLDENGDLRGETMEETKQLIIDEWNTIGQKDPHRLAVVYAGIFLDSDLSGVEEMENTFLNDSGAWASAHEEVMDFLKDGTFSATSLEGKSYHSIFDELGADGTPEVHKSFIRSGDGHMIQVAGEIVRDGITYEATLEFRPECGWQLVSLTDIYDNVPESSPGTDRPWVPETPPTTPETPEPETPPVEPETPEPETPPVEPETETPEVSSKKPNKDVNVNEKLSEQIQMGEDRVEPGDFQEESEVVSPPAEYVPPAPIPGVEVAPDATVVAPAEREEEISNAPVAEDANSVISDEVQEELRDSGAGELEVNENNEPVGNDGRVDG